MTQYPQHQGWQPARPHELGYGTGDRVVFNFFNLV
jgi:hypothetical protein